MKLNMYEVDRGIHHINLGEEFDDYNLILNTKMVRTEQKITMLI